jgi:GT2 family glycosyltransferase
MGKERKSKGRAVLLVLNYNAKPFLKNCLESMLRQTYQPLEVWVIDNASVDGSANFVREHFPRVKLLVNRINYGVGRGFNDAVKKALKSFDYIGLLDTDIKLDRNWLKEAIGTLEKNPEAEICNSLTLNWDGTKVDNIGGTITNFFAGSSAGFLGDLPTKKIPRKYRTKEFPVLFVVATGMLTRASTFRKFGFYDEDYFVYFEDIDFGWRVSVGGGEVLCNPRAVVYHYGHGSKVTKNISLKLLKQTEINLLATYIKNLSTLTAVFVLPLVFLSRLIGSLFYLPISPKITIAKLEGLINFLAKLLTGKYHQQRKFIAKIRKRNDLEVLSLNPTPIVSFSPIFSTMKTWLKTIRDVYSDS